MHRSTSEESRRAFLTKTAVTVTGLGLLSQGPLQTAATPTQQPATQGNWLQYNADAANTAWLADGVGPTGDIEQVWSTGFDRIHDGVAVVGQTVYVGGKALAAVNAPNGHTRWTFAPSIPDELDDPSDAPVPDVGPPAVMGRTVYANVWFGPYDGGTYDTALIAVDARTGKRRWRFDTPGTGPRDIAPVTVADGVVVTTIPTGGVGSSANLVTAFTAEGEIRWQRRIDEMDTHALPISDGRVYVSTPTGVRALDLETGETVWTALPRVRFQPTATPIVSDGTLFVVEYGETGVTLIAFDAATGNEYWRTAYDTSPGLTIGTVDDERVYIQVYGIDADVIALDCSDGSERWRAHIEQRDVPVDGFAQVGDLLYVGGAALDPTDGTVVWAHSMPVSAYGWTLEAVTGGRVYLSSGSLVALTGTTNTPP